MAAATARCASTAKCPPISAHWTEREREDGAALSVTKGEVHRVPACGRRTEQKVLRKLGGEGITLHVVYEAGPTGFVIYRRLQQLGIYGIVVAPAKTSQEKGLRQDRAPPARRGRIHPDDRRVARPRFARDDPALHSLHVGARIPDHSIPINPDLLASPALLSAARHFFLFCSFSAFSSCAASSSETSM
jgi:hypothetical protein